MCTRAIPPGTSHPVERRPINRMTQASANQPTRCQSKRGERKTYLLLVEADDVARLTDPRDLVICHRSQARSSKAVDQFVRTTHKTHTRHKSNENFERTDSAKWTAAVSKRHQTDRRAQAIFSPHNVVGPFISKSLRNRNDWSHCAWETCSRCEMVVPVDRRSTSHSDVSSLDFCFGPSMKSGESQRAQRQTRGCGLRLASRPGTRMATRWITRMD